MLALEVGLLLALLAVCSFTPGFFFVRILRWSPLEKLCGSAGLSLILIYLAAWAIYCLGPREQGPACAAVSLVSMALGAVAWRDLRKLACAARVRQALASFAFLLAWTLLVLGMIRSYSGGRWSGDWLEHFQRTLFFLHRLPLETPIAGGYLVPARPPLMNLLAAFFLAQTADRFELFQVVFTFLNLLVFLPCCLMAGPFADRKKRWSAPPASLLGLFAMNPVVMQNATYTWTKLFTAFFVVLALWFYLAGWRKRDPGRMVAAFAALSAGILTHFSALVYAVFLALHYLCVVFWRRRRRRWAEFAALVGVSGLLLGTWFGWAVAVYGARIAFTSNNQVDYAQQAKGSTLVKIERNLVDSIVPRPLRGRWLMTPFDQPSRAGTLRDNMFLFYQQSALFGMGIVGGPMAVWLMLRARPRFWRAMVPFCVVAGVAVFGERDPWGLAQISLLTIEVLGLALLARAFARRRAAAVLLMAGCLVDFSLGVYLQARVEGIGDPSQLSQWARDNARRKHLSDPSEDALYWGGWYGRHGGAMQFLGDRTAGVPAALLLVAFLGLTGAMLAGVSRAAPQPNQVTGPHGRHPDDRSRIAG